MIGDGAWAGVFVWKSCVNRIHGAKLESGVETPLANGDPPTGVFDPGTEPRGPPSGTHQMIPPPPPHPAPTEMTGGTTTARAVSSSYIALLPEPIVIDPVRRVLYVLGA